MGSQLQNLIDTLEAGEEITPQQVKRTLQLQALYAAKANEEFIEEINEQEKVTNGLLTTGS